MTTLTDRATAVRPPALLGKTVGLLGGSSGIGLEVDTALTGATFDVDGGQQVV